MNPSHDFVLVVNPGRGERQQWAINKQFTKFMVSHPVYLKEFVLNSVIGKIKHFLYPLQQKILIDWVNSTGHRHVELYKLLKVPEGNQYVHLGDSSSSSIAEEFHRFFMKHHKYHQRHARTFKTSYTYGRGCWTVTCTFGYQKDSVATQACVKNLRMDGKPFSPSNPSTGSC